MKKILSLVLAASMLIAAAACSSSDEETAAEETTTVATTAAASTPEDAAKQAAKDFIDTLATGDIEAAAAMTTEDSIINTYLNEVSEMGGGEESTKILGEYLGAYFSKTEIDMTSTSASGDIITVKFSGEAPKISDIEDYLESEEAGEEMMAALSELDENSSLDDLTVVMYESSIKGIEQASQGKWKASLDVDTSGDTPLIIDNEDFYPETSTELSADVSGEIISEDNIVEVTEETSGDSGEDEDEGYGGIASGVTISENAIRNSIELVGTKNSWEMDTGAAYIYAANASEYCWAISYDFDYAVYIGMMEGTASAGDVYTYDVYCNGEAIVTGAEYTLTADNTISVTIEDYPVPADGNTWEYVFYAPDSNGPIAFAQVVRYA